MKYLRKFNESFRIPTSEEVVEFINSGIPGDRDPNEFNPHLGSRIEITPDGLVNITEGSLHLKFDAADKNVTKLPFKFGSISGGLWCDAWGLTSLEGFPRVVGENFHLRYYYGTSLVGGPEIVDGIFNLWEPYRLKNLIGSPKYIGGEVFIKAALTSLEGCPETINGGLQLNGVLIKNFVGGPKRIEGELGMMGSALTSLEGLPEFIRDGFVVGGDIWDPTPLRDLEIQKGYVSFGRSPLGTLTNFFQWSPHNHWKEEWEWFADFQKTLDYNWIRGDANDPQINLFRFKEALDEIDVKLDEDIIMRGIGVKVRSSKIEKILYRFVDDEGRTVNFNGELI